MRYLDPKNDLTFKKVFGEHPHLLKTELDENSTEIHALPMNQREIRDAIECLQESAFTKGEPELYERYWDIIRVERARIEDADIKGINKGIKIGEDRCMNSR